MGSRIGRSGPEFGRSRAAQGGILRRIGRGLQAFLCLALLVVVALAVWFQLSGVPRGAVLAALAVVAAGQAMFWLRGQTGAVWLCGLVLFGAAGLWWTTVQPSNSRDWAADVAHGVTAQIDGDVVTVFHVRNFDWISEDQALQHWETRTFRLSDLQSVDLISSVWASPAIAHTLFSFGFADGRHIVFSAEIRKERDEVYSAIGGFFRKYELVLIAADERDIVRLRTDLRREWVSVYRIGLDPDQRRAAFLSFLRLGNDLAETPRWYNTLTSNCTTVVWRMARLVAPGLPLDWRVVLSGHFAAYLHDLGLVGPGEELADVIARAARVPVGPAGPDEAAFSRRLRAGL